MRQRIMRPTEWSDPPRPVHREVLGAQPVEPRNAPPVLFVPGFGHGAWVYAEHWLDHTADRGFPAYAMSLRGHGGSDPAPEADMRAYVHDVTQVAAGLPRQAVLVGSGAGARVVATALARYPARAAVLVSPVFGGVRMAVEALRRNPTGVAPALVGRGLRPGPGQLFSSELPIEAAHGYLSRLGRASARAQWELVRRFDPEDAVGDPPVLIVGSPDDRLVSRSALDRVAARYAGAPLLFPGMGHDLMLDAGWQEPIDAILDWLDKVG